MLRVAMVSPYSVSVPGGVQAQVMGLARELRRIGHEVRVLAPCDGPPPEPFVTPLGQSLPTSANGSVAPLAPDPSAALRTIRALNDEAFDIIHLHEPIVPGPTVTSLLLRLAPTVGTFHAAGDSSSYRVLNKTARWAANHLSARVAVSDAAKELASRYLDGDYQVLFNGIETSRYLKTGAQREAQPTIFFCGRFEPRKGLEVLLGAMKYLPHNFSLWIAADGPGINEMHRLHESDKRISWLGRITETDKLDRLSRCTVFCAPSLRGESFGIVLLEAMAAAAPLVTTDIDGYRNVATHELNALLVAPGDEEQLANSITRIVSDSNLTQRLVTGGLKRAEDFSMQRLAEEYVLIYERLLAAEKNDEIVVQPNKLLSMFEHRVLRRSPSSRS
ncbi:MAG: glycosyltransferase family 4 protein [Ilumatobacteraceae bacterium]|jgi:phosphatidyl-myo-inositol alpha-mannosyltransferase